MQVNDELIKIQLLINQQKYKEAESQLMDLLAANPNDTTALSLLAELKLQQDEYPQAMQLMENAIGVEPDNAYLYYMKSRIEIHLNDFSAAQDSIELAISLDPYDADYIALKANIDLSRKKYQEALNTANNALEIDPENILALNVRSTSLLKLNKTEESFETIKGALREDPTNAFTHANYGWSLLEKGNHQKALEHFSESLKNDPNFEYAQAGVIQSLKAKNWLYRQFLKYSFWMNNLSSKYQWGVILGFYFLVKFMRLMAKNYPTLEPFLIPAIIILVLIAFSTWVIVPISNLFLRFNKYGKLLLDKNEKRNSSMVAFAGLACIIGLLLFFILNDGRYIAFAGFGLALMLPFSKTFSPSKYKDAFLFYSIIMFLLSVLSLVSTFLNGEYVNVFSIIFYLSFLGFQWIVNFLSIKESNH